MSVFGDLLIHESSNFISTFRRSLLALKTLQWLDIKDIQVEKQSKPAAAYIPLSLDAGEPVTADLCEPVL